MLGSRHTVYVPWIAPRHPLACVGKNTSPSQPRALKHAAQGLKRHHAELGKVSRGRAFRRLTDPCPLSLLRCWCPVVAMLAWDRAEGESTYLSGGRSDLP